MTSQHRSYRGEYQRDRDRIIHSTAFRRLIYKTQVFVNHEGDLYRTRLTHSLEVSQIGRTVAVALHLNEPLTEAICLAHDLGHTPFGHAGQDTLNACMREYGGFEHNLQSLRVVDDLEAKYADFAGLNLMFETREGILKHCSARNARALGDVGERFLNASSRAWKRRSRTSRMRSPTTITTSMTAFGPACCRSSSFANSHCSQQHTRSVQRRYPDLEDRRLIYEIIRRMIGAVVTDLIEETRRQIESRLTGSIEDVRDAGKPLVTMSDAMYEQHVSLKRFLHKHLYSHEQKLEMTRKVQAMVQDLFVAYMEDTDRMPPQFRDAGASAEDADRARVVADYIAGMTDRYAIAAHESSHGLLESRCEFTEDRSEAQRHTQQRPTHLRDGRSGL